MIKKGFKKYSCVLFFLCLIVVYPTNAFVNKYDQQYLMNSSGSFLYVGGSGPNNYTKIQDAINDAVYGDTVYVYDEGSPYKELLVIDTSISLIGEDENTTVIDGDYKGTVVDIQADGVMVNGFTIINPDNGYLFEYNCVALIGVENVEVSYNRISVGIQEYNDAVAGIYFKNSSYNLIKNNIIFSNEIQIRTTGMYLDERAKNNNISGNEIYRYIDGIKIGLEAGSETYDNILFGNNLHHNNNGIDIFMYRTKIINNLITDCNSNGIDILNAENILISGNTVTNNGDGGEFDSGIAFNGGRNNKIIGNHISNNNPNGILLLGENVDIVNNYISSNKELGIYIDVSHNHRIIDNHISNNGEIGILNIGGNNIEISINNLIDNTRNAYFNIYLSSISSNVWDSNYWSDSLGLFPKIIPGIVVILLIFKFRFFDIDWHPAKEPYDIEIKELKV
jgi:nitrous oxidase accessory protein NosD